MSRTEDRVKEIIQLLAWRKKRDAIKKNLLPDFTKTVLLYAPANTMVAHQPSHSSSRGLRNVTNRPPSSSRVDVPWSYNAAPNSGALSVSSGPSTSQIETIATPSNQPGPSSMQINSPNNKIPARTRQLSPPSSLEITRKKSKDLDLEHKISEDITLYYSEREGEESAYFALTPGKTIKILEVTKYEIVEEKIVIPSSTFMKNLK